MGTDRRRARGMVISCPADHWLYRVARDIDLDKTNVMHAADVECIEDTMPRPENGKPIRPECSYCGQLWTRVVNGRRQTHFVVDGWWPRAPDANIEKAPPS